MHKIWVRENPYSGIFYTVSTLGNEQRKYNKPKQLITNLFRESANPQSYICGALRDLAPFVQFKKREKHPWTSVNFSKVAGFSLQPY